MSAAPSRTFHYMADEYVVNLLALLGGYIDAAGYLKLQGVFTSSITGNLVVAATSVASLKGVVCRSCVCIAFTLAGAVCAGLALKLKSSYKWSAKSTTLLVFGIQACIFAVVWAIGIYFNDTVEAALTIDAPEIVLIASLLGASMGVHNIAAKEGVLNCPSTTVMTMTMIAAAQNGANTLCYKLAGCGCLSLVDVTKKDFKAPPCCSCSPDESFKAKYDDAHSKFAVAYKPLLSFTIGSLLGAIIMYKGGFHCMAVALFIVLLIMFDIATQMWHEASSSSSATTTTASSSSSSSSSSSTTVAASATAATTAYTSVPSSAPSSVELIGDEKSQETSVQQGTVELPVVVEKV